MCGIVGAIAKKNVVDVLVEGLRRLEYRGYDSAGVALLDEANCIQRVRMPGKVKRLEDELKKTPANGHLGIAHTRWATHGIPNQSNAHPHVCRKSIAVVHNGIIENFETLKQVQQADNYIFTSDTDTEVIVHQLHKYMEQEKSLYKAVCATVKDLQGAYALGVISTEEPDTLITARRGSPLVIGLGKNANYIASDVAALLSETREFIYLEEGDVAILRATDVEIYDQDGQQVERSIHHSNLNTDSVGRGEYAHYMLKEIYEQPRALAETLEGRLGEATVLESAFGPEAAAIFDKVEQVQIIACGTSYHAGLIARYGFEALAGIPCNVEVASEFRYRHAAVLPNTLFVTISQSGETADTLAALRASKEMGFAHSLSICNVAESSLVRESDLVLMTRAGPEIGVASTKAFTTQLVALLLLIIVLGRRHKMDNALEARLVEQLRQLPLMVEQVLKFDDDISKLAMRFADKHNALFLGRGEQYPVAMEGALKLKEISYIHAEAYPAGELKHGPLALVDAQMPIVVVAPNDELLDKLKANLQEVRARGGELYVFADVESGMQDADGVTVINVAPTDKAVSPIVFTIPLQLLSYHVALIKGTDVDQPRNLAKSVTVE
ncbi:Glutamine--fructose-6-phosphate aminotransferase [isomerizing] [hydrothermal vent metagenome]|uniref:Glutamine--fructose-6-phosphate aminotransferase [isomerizing] n=1 Tax=hydrothermal vent metagenome TaxID=652676 RepID=A0A3B1C2A9_9ZZZZ